MCKCLMGLHTLPHLAAASRHHRVIMYYKVLFTLGESLSCRILIACALSVTPNWLRKQSLLANSLVEAPSNRMRKSWVNVFGSSSKSLQGFDKRLAYEIQLNMEDINWGGYFMPLRNPAQPSPTSGSRDPHQQLLETPHGGESSSTLKHR